MKEYIKSRIYMSLELMFIIPIIFLLNETPQKISSLSTALNSNLTKNVSKDVIQASQDELYKEGIYNPLYTFNGDLTGYAGDCALCSGYLACPPRTNVLKEGIYYKDKTYGTVRIAASSKLHPCGTIIRFKSKKFGSEPVIAIILDRGVGGNDIDLLTESEEFALKNVGRIKSQEFEVLREGWIR